MEEISCIFCGKLSSDIVIRENGYSGLKCNTCNLIYISKRPTEREISYLYTDKNAAIDADTQYQFEKIQRLSAKETLRKISKYKQEGSLLEIGPGGGFFLNEAREFGFEPFGIELNPIEARWINDKLKIPCENVPLNNESFGRKKFDIIYHRDVLSHLPDPISSFNEMNMRLNDGGLIVFETGNIADVLEKYYKYFSQFSYPEHLFFFGEKSIQLLLDRTGFKCFSLHRTNIFLQLLLQKAFWFLRQSLKENSVLDEIKTCKNPVIKGSSLKRKVRILYRYAGHYLLKIGKILPKNGRPLKLLVMAIKI